MVWSAPFLLGVPNLNEIVIVTTLARSGCSEKISTRWMTKIKNKVSVNSKTSVKNIQKDLKTTGTNVHVSTLYRTLTRQEFHW